MTIVTFLSLSPYISTINTAFSVQPQSSSFNKNYLLCTYLAMSDIQIYLGRVLYLYSLLHTVSEMEQPFRNIFLS